MNAAVATRSTWIAGRRLAAVLVVAALSAGSILAVSDSASAADGRDFNPGMIMSDAVFYDGNAASVSEVQAFLNSRVQRCEGRGGQPCLKDYRQSTSATQVLPNRCWGIPAMSNVSAAEIIVRVGQACNINPKALIVLLQKEQGLVTSTSPTSNMYRIATGFGCPDTAACDTQFYGFFNQVYNAARQFQTYRVSSSSFRYRAGQVNNIQWHPNAGCGSSAVYIENQATAGLYNYTPYQPNAAAMANLYGTGDSCSSYGNRNFWRTYMDWFGTTFSESEAVAGIHALWVRTGGDQGTLGRATSNLSCSAAGCKRHFSNGIAYSPLGGTFAVTGGHAVKYMQLGETGGVLGFPRSDEIRNSDGSYVAFQNGYSMWSPSTGVRAVTGGHATAYAARGGSGGELGYPTTDETPTRSGGTFVNYQRGLSIWSPASGLRVLSEPHAVNYRSQGGSEGVVGYPISDTVPTRSGGTFVTYQNGYSLWSARTGAAQISGGHAVAYAQQGGSEGMLGYPVTNETRTPSGGSYVRYENGLTVWSPSTGVRVLDRTHGTAYAALGGTESKVGYPISGVQSASNGGTFVAYRNGYSLWSQATGVQFVPAGHGIAYAAAGGSQSPYGYPTSGEVMLRSGGSAVSYQRGLSLWSAATGVRLLDTNHAAALTAAGGADGPLGYPVTGVQPTGDGGTYVQYQNGYTLWSARTGAYSVPGGHATAYARAGGSSGALGYPTSNETAAAANGKVVTFERGLSAWSPRTPVVLVSGGYFTAFASAGGVGGRLGYPTGDAVPTREGSTMNFERGRIRFTAATNSYAVEITG